MEQAYDEGNYTQARRENVREGRHTEAHGSNGGGMKEADTGSTVSNLTVQKVHQIQSKDFKGCVMGRPEEKLLGVARALIECLYSVYVLVRLGIGDAGGRLCRCPRDAA